MFSRFAFIVLSASVFFGSFTDRIVAQFPGSGLKDLAERWGVGVGFLVSPENVGNATYEDAVLREANVATVTAYWKFQVHNEGRDQYDWSSPDTTVAFAVENDLELHGHPLLWANDNFIPSWVLATPEDETESEDMIREHIEAVVGRYRGAVSLWHVVNEAFTYTGEPRDSYWYRTLGEDMLEFAFAAAHTADPDAKLIYNDYGMAEIDDRKYEAVKAKLTQLQTDEVPVHGIGWQLHMNAVQVLDENFPLEQRMQEMSLLGFTNYITELDIAIPSSSEENLILQRHAYHKITEIFLRVAEEATIGMGGAGAMQTWDVSDQQSWLGTASAPLLFDTEYEKKPAYFGVQAALAAEPMIDVNVRVTLNPAGLLLIRGSVDDNHINVIESDGQLHVSAYTRAFSREAALVSADLDLESAYTFAIADVKRIRVLLLPGDDSLSMFSLVGMEEVGVDGEEILPTDAPAAPPAELASLANVSVDVFGATGDDVVMIEDLSVGRTSVSLASGVSNVLVSGSTITGDMRIYGGLSADAVQLSSSSVEGLALVSLAGGENQIEIAECTFANSVTLIGSGATDVDIFAADIEGDLRITGGAGEDATHLSSVLIDGFAYLVSGGGDDELEIVDCFFGDWATVNTAGGDDTVRILGGGVGNIFTGNTAILLGAGDDELVVADTTFDGLFARLWGYAGADSLVLDGVTSTPDLDVRTMEQILDLSLPLAQ